MIQALLGHNQVVYIERWSLDAGSGFTVLVVVL